MPETDPPPPYLPDFTPVPRKLLRHDGWTPDRQRAFLEALAFHGSVTHAARTVNMAPENAYKLRRGPDGESFAAAWDAALDHAVRKLEDVAVERALNGVEEEIYRDGKKVGSRIIRNDRLLMFILRNRAPDRFAVDARHGRSITPTQVAALRAEWEAEKAADDAAALERVREEMARVRARIGERVSVERTEYEAFLQWRQHHEAEPGASLPSTKAEKIFADAKKALPDAD